ncbi:MAG: hypothetical protein JWN46_645 [Acidimicrobiales bacterium]|nr:hypothetical protein [Acidimicrobiales bacterium]
MVVSGLPGVGKSALADALGRGLGAPVLSVDPIEAALWRSGIAPSFETGLAAYQVAATLAAHQLSLGLTTIADAVSSIEVARAMWRRAAQSAGDAMRVIEVTCSDEAVHRERLSSRRRDIEGYPEPSWDAVQRRKDEFEPWTDTRLVIDSMADLSTNLATSLAYLGLEAVSAQDGAR